MESTRPLPDLEPLGRRAEDHRIGIGRDVKCGWMRWHHPSGMLGPIHCDGEPAIAELWFGTPRGRLPDGIAATARSRPY